MFYAKSIFYWTILAIHVYGENTENSNDNHEIKGYYWRDYTGIIPKDAILGGEDDKGKTYIGQMLHHYLGRLPGEISEVDKKMYYVFGNKVHSTTENVKILCSQNPEKIFWVPAKPNDKISDFKNQTLIVGGKVDKNTQLIGSLTLKNGKLAVGRILVFGELLTTIFVRNQTKALSSAGPYRVLVFNEPSSRYQSRSGCGKKVTMANFYFFLFLFFILFI